MPQNAPPVHTHAPQTTPSDPSAAALADRPEERALRHALKLRPASALLALADGTVFTGRSFGAAACVSGEAVFNTALTGYQEILTDPSYHGQLVTLTYPHIGNVGINADDDESGAVQAAGLIVRDGAQPPANFRSSQALGDYLREQGIPAIDGIDTRALTRRLRDGGAQAACLLALASGETIQDAHREQALQEARAYSGMAGRDLAQVVSTAAPYEWTQPSWRLEAGGSAPVIKTERHVVAYDFGIKRNILRMLADRGCRVTVVPARTAAADVLAMHPDGVFLSNGPGDPEPCDYAIEAARVFIQARMPLFGICLGHQLLALACGGRTLKMKFGHHGANHPVQELASKRVYITSQNHGFAVDPQSLPAHLKLTHVSLFDGSVQGVAHTQAPAFGFQGHPEASPGPHDIGPLFDQFVRLMSARNSRSAAA